MTMISQSIVVITFNWIIFAVVSHIQTRSQVLQTDKNSYIEVNKDDKWNEACKYLRVEI